MEGLPTRKKEENIMNTIDNTSGAQTDSSISAIDASTAAAVAAAKARKAAKADGTAAAEATGTKRVIKTPDQRKADLEKIEKERAERKAKKLAERNAKNAAAAQNKGPAHMKKVEKAAERLPALSTGAQAFFDDAKTGLSAVELEALAAHITHHCRANATAAATEQKLVVGQSVRIIKGNAKFIGVVGTVAKAQRIRCYITVPGSDKEVYLFNSDVEPFTAPAEQASEPEAPAADEQAA